MQSPFNSQVVDNSSRLQMKSFVMINNFILDDQKLIQGLHHDAIPSQKTKKKSKAYGQQGKKVKQGSHIRSISTGAMLPKQPGLFNDPKLMINGTQVNSQVASSSSLDPLYLKQSQQLHQHTNSHVITSTQLKNLKVVEVISDVNSQNSNGQGSRRHGMTKFVSKLTAKADQNLQQQSCHTINRQMGNPSLNNAIMNLKQFVQLHYPSCRSVIKPQQSRYQMAKPTSAYTSTKLPTNHKRDMSVKLVTKPPKSLLQPPIPQKYLVESRLVTQTKETVEEHQQSSDLNPQQLDDIDEDSHHQIISSTQTPYEIEEAYMSRNQAPIPAFTSLEVANKLRHRSEDRYINEHMEYELEAYKVEIERRFKNAQVKKDYKFPRVIFQAQESILTPINFDKLKASFKENVENKTNKANKENLITESSCSKDFKTQQSTKHHQAPENQYGSNINNSVDDYKKILSRFLSSSVSTSSQEFQIYPLKVQTAVSIMSNDSDGFHLKSQKLIQNQKQPDTLQAPTLWKPIKMNQNLNIGQLQKLSMKLNQMGTNNTTDQRIGSPIMQQLQTPILKQKYTRQNSKGKNLEYSGFNSSRNPIINLKQISTSEMKSGKKQQITEASEQFTTFINSDTERGKMKNESITQPSYKGLQPLSSRYKTSLQQLKVGQNSSSSQHKRVLSIEKVDYNLQTPAQINLKLSNIIPATQRNDFLDLNTRNQKLIPSHQRAQTTFIDSHLNQMLLHSSINNSNKGRQLSTKNITDTTVAHSCLKKKSTNRTNSECSLSEISHSRYTSRENNNVLAIKLHNNQVYVQSRPKPLKQNASSKTLSTYNINVKVNPYGNPTSTSMNKVQKLLQKQKTNSQISSSSSCGGCPYIDQQPSVSNSYSSIMKNINQIYKNGSGNNSTSDLNQIVQPNTIWVPNGPSYTYQKRQKSGQKKSITNTKSNPSSKSSSKTASKCGSKKILQSKTEECPENKRDFKIKCLKIDLFKNAEQLQAFNR